MTQQIDHIGDTNKMVTAVEWLIEQISEKQPNGLYVIDTLEDVKRVFEQAKQMEKEQIQKAFSAGQETPINHHTLPHYSREEYYNETYVK